MSNDLLKNILSGPCLVKLVEHATLDIGVMSSNPMCGTEFT